MSKVIQEYEMTRRMLIAKARTEITALMGQLTADGLALTPLDRRMEGTPMTDEALIEAINSRSTFDGMTEILRELAHRIGVKPEPPAPARDEFDEMADAIDIDPDTTVRSIAVWVARLRSDIASALRAEAEKGKAAREKMKELEGERDELDKALNAVIAERDALLGLDSEMAEAWKKFSALARSGEGE